MNDAVLDSSALLALLFNEPGADRVSETLPGALLSTVNFAETLAKLTERGVPVQEARAAVEATGVEIVDFDADQACMTSALRPLTRSAGLSLGDRACLALARSRDRSAVTADHVWATVPGFDVVIIRDGR
jgi:ribonuclease VapC